MAITLDTGKIHPATEAAIQALQWLQERAAPTNILDLGCGDGILSVTAAHIWDAQVLGADISPNAVADATRLVKEHGLEERMTVVRSDGFSNPQLAASAPYDLIIANLVAELLLKFAPVIQKSMAPGGLCLLSGILAWMTPQIEAIYQGLGFEIVERITFTPWHGYILKYVNTVTIDRP